MSLVVVALTNYMDLDHKENRAYTILYRLQSRVNLNHKAAEIITVVLRIRGLDLGTDQRIKNIADPKELEIVKQEYLTKRAELISNLEFLKGLYVEEDKNLQSSDSDPVEEIRALTLQIENDFMQLKRLLITVREIEASLESVKMSNEVLHRILDQCQGFQKLFMEELMKFKGGIFNIEKQEDSEMDD